MMNLSRILLCLTLLSNINLVFSAPVFEAVKKALNIGWEKMPESERSNQSLIQEAQLHDRNRRITLAQKDAKYAKLLGHHEVAKEKSDYALQRQASAKRIEGSLALLDSDKPLRMKEGMSGNHHKTEFKPRRLHWDLFKMNSQ